LSQLGEEFKPPVEVSAPVSEQSANPQEPRRLKTRAALMLAGAELLSRRPIDAIPVNDIVEMAGVAKGSFFNHFEDKDEFAAAIATEIRLDVESRVTAANAGVFDPAERMARAMSVVAQFALAEPRRARIMMHGHPSEAISAHPLNQGIRNDIALGLASGRFRPAADGAGVILVVGVGQMILTALTQDRVNLAVAQRLIKDALVLVLTGLGVAEAEAAALAARAVGEVVAGAASSRA